MWVIRFLLLIVVTVSVKSEEYVEVEGTGGEFDGRQITCKIERTHILQEDPKCLKMGSIENIKGMSIIPKNFFANLTNLRTIKLQNISQIEPGALTQDLHLISFQISESSLKQIPEGVFNHIRVHYLLLDNNGIETIAPRAFNDMPNLDNIFLNGNKLTQWYGDWFFNTPNLVFVSMVSNRIEELPDGAFKNIRNDAWIDLTRNSIEKLGRRLYAGAKKASYLNLAYNKINRFDDWVLEGLEEMGILDISHNLIECFSENLDGIFVANATRFCGNPVRCDCAMKISDWEKRQLPQIRIAWDAKEKCGIKKQDLYSWCIDK